MGACHSETEEYRLGRTGFGHSGLSVFFVFLFFLSVDDEEFPLVDCSDISSVCPRQGKGSL